MSLSQLPIAETWFERRRIDDGVTLLREPHVDPFLRCNIWHVRGRDCDLLIDTGLGVASLSEAARDLFDRSLNVVLTHTHLDHAGGAHEFETVCVHRAEAEDLHLGRDIFDFGLGEPDADTRAWFESVGYELAGGLLTAIPSKGYAPDEYRLAPAQATRLLEDGDVVSTGDRHFEVLHLPGHSPGSIGLWEAATQTLFSGDALYDGPLLDTIPGADIPTYCRSMERLRSLPVRTVHAGHDESFGRERLIELVDAYLADKG